MTGVGWRQLPLALTALWACSARPALPEGEPGIRGIITAVQGETVRIEAQPEDSAGSDKAVVRLLPSTRIFRGQERVGSEAIRVGQRAGAWFSGPVMESYPVQARAAAIVIDAEPGGSGE